jgi:hypothetical protein
MKSGHWGTSYNQEIFTGDYATRDEAVEAAQEYLMEGLCVWIGQYRKPAPPENFLDAFSLIEHIQMQDDYNMDVAESWPDAREEEMDDLSQQLRMTFAQWLDSYGLRPTHYVVDASAMEEIVGDTADAHK